MGTVGAVGQGAVWFASDVAVVCISNKFLGVRSKRDSAAAGRPKVFPILTMMDNDDMVGWPSVWLAN